MPPPPGPDPAAYDVTRVAETRSAIPARIGGAGPPPTVCFIMVYRSQEEMVENATRTAAGGEREGDLVIVSMNTQSHWKGKASTAARMNYRMRTKAGGDVDLVLAQETWMYADDRTEHLMGLVYQCAGRLRTEEDAEKVGTRGSGLLAMVGPQAKWETGVKEHRMPCARIQTVQVKAVPALFVINVYGPVGGAEMTREEFREALEREVEAVGNAAVIIVGDWNMNPSRMSRKWRTWMDKERLEVVKPPRPTYLDRTTPDFCAARKTRGLRVTVENYDKNRLGMPGSAHGAIMVRVAGLRRARGGQDMTRIPGRRRMGPRLVEWKEYSRLEVEALGEEMEVEEMERKLTAAMVANIMKVSKPGGKKRVEGIKVDEMTWKKMVEADRSERPAQEMIKVVAEWAKKYWVTKREELEEDIRGHEKSGFTATKARLEAGKARWNHDKR